MGHFPENETCSREWNMFKRMEQHVPENGTCSREWNMFKRMEHVPGKLVDVQTWSWFIAAVDLSQQVLSGSQMFQLSNKQTNESFYNFSTFSTVQECKKIPLIHYGCRFLTLIAFPIYICIHKNYFLFSIFLVLIFHVTTYMQYKQSKLLKWLLKGIVIRDLRGLQTIFLEKSTVFPLK